MTAAVALPLPPLRVLAEDDTLHFSDVKKLSLSGRQYLAAVNEAFEPTRAMRLGTLIHFLVFGAQREGADPIVCFPGDTRRGKTWDAFAAEHPGADIYTQPEWDEAEAVAESVLADPIARARLEGARFEVPLTWEDAGFRCSTSGIDIVTAGGALGDLKTTSTTEPQAWQRLAFRMHYAQQLAWYARGARANGLSLAGGLFLLGVETRAPYEVVELELTEQLIDHADRTVTLWLEKLRTYVDACPHPKTYLDWPGYAASSVAWDVPPWLQQEESEDDDLEDGAS